MQIRELSLHQCLKNPVQYTLAILIALKRDICTVHTVLVTFVRSIDLANTSFFFYTANNGSI